MPELRVGTVEPWNKRPTTNPAAFAPSPTCSTGVVIPDTDPVDTPSSAFWRVTVFSWAAVPLLCFLFVRHASSFINIENYWNPSPKSITPERSLFPIVPKFSKNSDELATADPTCWSTIFIAPLTINVSLPV